ncbi:MAG: NUDIX domain-containing protein [Candidatus Binatia bacterium]
MEFEISHLPFRLERGQVVDEQEIDQTIRELAGKLPQLPDGRIDYSHSDTALVITCFVKFEDKILLLQRSDKVRTYQGKWNTVAGYIDEAKPLGELALRELREEVGISAEDIADIKIGNPFEFHDPDLNKNWRVQPVLAQLRRSPEIKMDWEHTDYRWIFPREINRFDIVPKLEESLKRVLSF